MEINFETLRGDVERALAEAMDIPSLEALRVRMLGKKGEITQLLKTLGTLAPDERRVFGQKVNDFRRVFEQGITEAREFLQFKQQSQAIEKETIDVTLPGRRRAIGRRHPIASVQDKLTDLFIGLGFTVAEGPHIESEYYNFEALNTPADHPSRDEQDTLYITDRIVLRTQTSPVQVRTMESMKPPIRIVAPGKVFRADEIDATHTPVFHQIEGLVIDKGITLGDLKGIQELAARHLFGENTKIRFRPSYFPFTEPSAEVDVTCHACGGNVPPEGCRVCKDSGWVELWGCGMVHPRVLEMSGIDPKVYSGYAFGMGIDRITSSLFGITDPRNYFENDMNFLAN
ncbi:MAG: phenylalanine--tRNA ligase subunit alpha [Clostridiales bacterium]|jgi:phenylalanyl-tRNA synthetase alpha chain|nr:phenylalanine--tRNA ligase subunit alpha [Clostridiales bacterium]